MDEISIYRYSPYGQSLTPASPHAAIAFNGQYRDPITQAYLLGLGYRTYSPALMRFHSPDSLSPFSSGGFNAYAYVENDPVNYKDPTGHVRLFSKIKVFQGNGRAVNGGKIYLAKHPENKKEQAITAVYHGVENYLTGERGPISPREFIQSIKKKVGFDVTKHDIHVIACHSADAGNGQASFIESVATLTGRRAYGYSGRVMISEKEYPISNNDVFYDTVIFKKLPSYNRNKRDLNYRLVTAPAPAPTEIRRL